MVRDRSSVSRFAGCSRLPNLSYRFVLRRQPIGDLDFASDEAFVIFLEFGGEIAIIYGDAIGITQAVGPQVSKSVDSLEARAIRKMKHGDGIVELTALTHLCEIGKRQALQRPCENFSMGQRLLQQMEKSFDEVPTPPCGGESAASSASRRKRRSCVKPSSLC